jgi:PAS domain S-box-containing protein
LPRARATEPTITDVAPDVSLKAIVDHVAMPVWVTDGDGIVLLANPAAVAVLGYDDATELQGRSGHDAVHHMHRDGSPYPA